MSVAGTTIDPENSKKCRGAAENPAPGRVRWAQALESVVRMLARQRVGGVDIRHLFFKWCPILWGAMLGSLGRHEQCWRISSLQDVAARNPPKTAGLDGR